VIVVIGSLRLRGSGSDAEADGLAASIAAAAAASGARVELIGKLGDDPAGDAVLLSLARHGVGHVALLRDPGRRTTTAPAIDERIDLDESEALTAEGGAAEPAGAGGSPTLEAADAGLALRYLPEISVIVAVHLAPEVLTEAAAAAGWAETSLVVVVPADGGPPDGLPAGAVTLAVADDDESAVGGAIGRYAAALDRGDPADAAYDAFIAAGRG
jgi:sugar/nucleoside kinase (ribokinase family)